MRRKCKNLPIKFIFPQNSENKIIYEMNWNALAPYLTRRGTVVVWGCQSTKSMLTRGQKPCQYSLQTCLFEAWWSVRSCNTLSLVISAHLMVKSNTATRHKLLFANALFELMKSLLQWHPLHSTKSLVAVSTAPYTEGWHYKPWIRMVCCITISNSSQHSHTPRWVNQASHHLALAPDEQKSVMKY